MKFKNIKCVGLLLGFSLLYFPKCKQNSMSEKDQIYLLIRQYFPEKVLMPDALHGRGEIKIDKLKEVLLNPPIKERADLFLRFLEVKFGKRLGGYDMTLFGSGNPCYHYCYDDKYVIYISIISNYYYIYHVGDEYHEKITPKGEEFEIIISKLKELFPDFKFLSPKIAKEIVPDVAIGNMFFGEVTVLNCLFTDHIY